MQEYIAHKNEITGELQSVKEHSENTARLCYEYAVPEWKNFMYAMGLLHDIGKYQPSFVRRIHGENVRVEHSTCGALAVREHYGKSYMALMMEYGIAGHHTGIPDGGFLNDEDCLSPTLSERMKREFEDFSRYKEELEIPELDLESWGRNLIEDCKNEEQLADKFAFFTRYAFSCLVDADSNDTAKFCRMQNLPKKLEGDFSACLNRVNQKLRSFQCETELQQARAVLQNQAFQNIEQNAEIYLLNMPTGSGKTLASAKIALERAIAGNKKRIIYVIPYNGIIEQTVKVFEDLFGEDMDILRHQSTFSYEDEENGSEDYRLAAKSAVENWDAPFIVTTAVQFFGSIYANKRGKLRKMHNMSDSILIFDEAHLMPQSYLQPCLQGISYITKYLNSEAVFLTATMPDFEQLIRTYAIADIRIHRLIQDTSDFKKFQKCTFSYLNEIMVEELLERSENLPSSLIIVNSKAKAREIYKACEGDGGKNYHLSTYMTAHDRRRVIQEICDELALLGKDYKNVSQIPKERRIRIVSTSLIEAGVDLDVHTVFRERTGLDSILQSGGRCNREGKRTFAVTYVFDWKTEKDREKKEEKNKEEDKDSLTKGLLEKYADISVQPCLEEYYARLYALKSQDIQKRTMHQFSCQLSSLPFQKYAQQFKPIDDRMISLVIPQDKESQVMVEQLKYTKSIDVRRLQNYTCSVKKKELEDLVRQHAADDFGTGIFCLVNPDYYAPDLGVLFEAIDYFL